MNDAAASFVCTPLGKMRSCSDAYVSLLGFESSEQALATNIGKLFPDQRSKYMFVKQLFEEQRAENYAVELKRTDGSKLNVMINATATLDDDGFVEQIEGAIYLQSNHV